MTFTNLDPELQIRLRIEDEVTTRLPYEGSFGSLGCPAEEGWPPPNVPSGALSDSVSLTPACRQAHSDRVFPTHVSFDSNHIKLCFLLAR